MDYVICQKIETTQMLFLGSCYEIRVETKAAGDNFM